MKAQIWTIFDPTSLKTIEWQLDEGHDLSKSYGLGRNLQELDSGNYSDGGTWRDQFCPKGSRSVCPHCCTYEQSMWIARQPYRDEALWRELVKKKIFPEIIKVRVQPDIYEQYINDYGKYLGQKAYEFVTRERANIR